MVANYDKLQQDILDTDILLPYAHVLATLREVSTPIDSSKPVNNYAEYASHLGFFKGKGVNSILTEEFIEELYREMRSRRLADIPMIEICAGRGKLSYQLRKHGIDIVATDNYSQKMDRDESLVERVESHREALEKYTPRLVVASWIPRNPEIGDDVLHFPTVDYFIDIGERRSGSTWLTLDYSNEDFSIKYYDFFEVTRSGKVGFVKHSQVRLWKRKGVPMSINHTI
jgi:hypothetical protein|tara:strand:+ start:79 stop:762 length:684 start_codon:yes stop_codon:yes gene_type:complete